MNIIIHTYALKKQKFVAGSKNHFNFHELGVWHLMTVLGVEGARKRGGFLKPTIAWRLQCRLSER